MSEIDMGQAPSMGPLVLADDVTNPFVARRRQEVCDVMPEEKSNNGTKSQGWAKNAEIGRIKVSLETKTAWNL